MRVQPEGEWPRDRVLAVLNEQDVTQGPASIAELFRKLSVKTPPVPAPRRLRQQDRQERYTQGAKTTLKDETVSLLSDSGTRVIRVLDRGRELEGYYDLGYFRVPSKTRAAGLKPLSVSRHEDRVTITTEVIGGNGGTIQTKLDVDWASGVAIHRQALREGSVFREVIYSGLTAFPGSITVPRVVTTLYYTEGHLKTMDLAVITSAQFNTPFPAGTFQISKPEKWAVLDFRGQAEGTRFEFPTQAVDDIRSLIPSQPLDPLRASPIQMVEQTSPWRRLLLALNGLVLIGVAIWFWKRSGTDEVSK